MDSIIKVDNLIYDYERDEGDFVHALRGVSLEIERGSFTCILGKNGSGKSTFAKCLNGLLTPTGGKVLIDGYDTSDFDNIWNIRQTLGMVFQNPDNQLVSAIVEDDVAFGPENLGVDPKEIRRRVDKALDDVHMGEFKQKAPHLLSGGQKQRIAIAGVVAMRPKCIVFDEPTAMLDPRGRKEIMKIIKELHEDGITVILVTHFMEEATEADRVIVMDEGRILIDGTPDFVFSERDLIEKANLDVPLMIELGYRLNEAGIEVPRNMIKEEEMAEYLCQLK